MRQVTVSFNRQVIRLGKGVIKAWEQRVDAMELENSNTALTVKAEKSDAHNGFVKL